MANKSEDGGGLEALHRIKSTEPPLFLTPSPELSHTSRTASEFIFSSLKPYTPKSPFDQLLTNGYDSEQIWQQIDLQSQPLISSLRRQIKRFEKEPARIFKGFDAISGKMESLLKSAGVDDVEQDDDSDSGFEEDEDEEEDDDEEDLELSKDDDEMKENAMEEASEEDESGDEEEKEERAIEDKFLKIKDLEKYLKENEEREYGLKMKPEKAGGKKKSKDVNISKEEEEEEEDDDDEEEDEEEDDELGLFEEGNEDEDDELENARYEDFYVAQNKKTKKKHKQIHGSDDLDAEDEQEDTKVQRKEKLSRHEKEQKQLQAKIAEMEKSSLDPKTWTMQGEVTAAKRPLNSALEADLDFEHNVKPPPAITEEVTASIEEIIKKRIVEGRFDDVQRAAKLPSKAPREFKDLDDNKSKKGLAEIYEEEYLEKTGSAPASLSFSDELKKEASDLFKRLTWKLNALSHFHFAPKPVVEDMAVETNLPALAMEEVAPVAVSDAAMLAPEEVFDGKGDVKEEIELTQEDRKRRRAKKKRKFKAEQTKRLAKKPRETPVITQGEGKVAVVKV